MSDLFRCVYTIHGADEMLIALLVMHEAGWVHRDISVGNLYLYKDPVTRDTRGLIGDFEYAKEVGWGGKD